MKFFILTSLMAILLLSCVHKEKESPAPSPLPIEEKESPVSTGPAVGAMNASLKGYRQIRASGLVHLVPEANQLHIEVILEGLKPGPYKINLNASKKCRGATASRGRDIGELVADGKGTVKANFDLGLRAAEALGKRIIIYTKEKRHTQVAACGIVERI